MKSKSHSKFANVNKTENTFSELEILLSFWFYYASVFKIEYKIDFDFCFQYDLHKNDHKFWT